MNIVHTIGRLARPRRTAIVADQRVHATSPWLLGLLCGLALSACASSGVRTTDADVSYVSSAAKAADDALARRCAIQVGSAHPRGVVTPPAFERCIQRHETLRFRAILRAVEKSL